MLIFFVITIFQLTKQEYTILKIYPKNENLYTEGLLYTEDYEVIESSGLYGKSEIVKFSYPAFNVENRVKIRDNYFGEGIAICGNYLYQLTWLERKILKFTLNNFNLVSTLNMDDSLVSGWGMTDYVNNQMIATDGSNKIYFLNCSDLKVTKSLEVKQNNIKYDKLNSLAFDGGWIYANVYMDKIILKIDPLSGNVVNIYDMSKLIDYEFENKTLDQLKLNNGNVLNGIAYNKKKNTFLLTGKFWGFYYEIIFK